jgi:hypothetical protein
MTSLRISVEKAADILCVPTLYVYGLINRGTFNVVGGSLLASEVIAYNMIKEAYVIECVALPGEVV